MAYSLPALINGKSYEWSDIVFNILGLPFAGVTAIEYEDMQEMDNVYGAGNRPVSRVYKSFMPTAKITLLMEELEAIQAAAPQGIIQRIPEFDITVAFADGSIPTRIHTIKNCRFKNNTRKVSQGDGAIACELELVISHVEFV